jgi:hypothetical protein
MRHGSSAARPIIVGVTGHRKLSGADNDLTRLIARELAKLARRYDGAPLLVLSGLAEGADRLVVEAVRAMGGTHVAVVPLPDALYLKDFATVASRSAYAHLRAAAVRVISAPLLAKRRYIEDHGEPRNHQYAWIGAYIAKRAQVLIAVWDGEPARGTGGTAQVVDWFLSGTTPGGYRISRAPRLAGRGGVAKQLIHINSATNKVRSIACRNASPARRQP